MSNREEICKSLGFKQEAEIYQLIVSAVQADEPQLLLSRRLNSSLLTVLGYDLAGMRRLRASVKMLVALGYISKPAETPEPREQSEGVVAEMKKLLEQGLTAGQLHERGYTIHHLKKFGLSLAELERLGFRTEDFVQAFSASELKRSGYGAKELIRHFSGQDLRAAGFNATEMRMAGFTIPELIKFGYNENHIRTAGYSIVELVRAGFSRQTVDKAKFTR
jgi:ribosomal protein L13E